MHLIVRGERDNAPIGYRFLVRRPYNVFYEATDEDELVEHHKYITVAEVREEIEYMEEVMPQYNWKGIPVEFEHENN